MRLISLFLISMIFPIQAYSQNLPHKFKDGDVIYADQINDNFEYLQGVRETTVDCGSSGNGSGINNAINEGYNSIIIKGFCKENLSIDGRSLNTSSLKLRGYNNDPSQDKILDASNNENYLISLAYNSMFVKIDNLTLSGGKRGIYTWANVNLRITNTNIEKYTSVGLRLANGSTIYADNLNFDGSIDSAETNQNGIQISGSSMGYFEGLSIQNNMNNGIDIWQSGTWLSGTINLSNNDTGINISTGGKLSFNNNAVSSISESRVGINGNQSDVKLDGKITVSNSERAISFNNSSIVSGAELELLNNQDGINIGLSSLEMWDSSSILISNTSIGRAFWAGRSQLLLRNITINGDRNIEEDLFTIGDGCSSDIRNVLVTNSGGNGVKFNNAESYIDNLTSTNNLKDGIDVYRSSINIKNSNISNNDKNGLSIHQGSKTSLRSSSVLNNLENGIEAKRLVYLQVQNSNIMENSRDGIHISRNSYLDIYSTEISQNLNHGISARNLTILDFGDDGSGGSPIIISNNSYSGIMADMNVNIEFDDDTVVQVVQNNGSLDLGKNTYMSVWDGDLTVDQEINCWSSFSKDPNDSSITQESEKPIIEFNYTTGLPQISSNCRIITPND